MEQKPSEVRQQILADHEILRRMLERLEVRARRVLQGKSKAAAGLREEFEAVESRLRGHLELEERVLVPALLEADAWGRERAERCYEEHARQRQIMDAVRASERTPHEFALLAWGFVRLIREDMAEEEKLSLNERVLRDDPIETAIEPE